MPFWVNDEGTGCSAVYDATGAKQFAVTVPAKCRSTSHGSPSGIVYDFGGSGFNLPGSSFSTVIFVTLDGMSSGWNSNTPDGVLALDNSATGASYTGLALATGANGPLLFAANCGNWTVGTFNKQFAPTALAGGFADPALPLQEPVSPIRYGAV